MAHQTISTQDPEISIQLAPPVAVCRHHWVIQPADGPVSNGSCQVCGEIREFKNYVESATWGDSRISGKGASSSTIGESTSDDEYMNDQDLDAATESTDEEIEV